VGVLCEAAISAPRCASCGLDELGCVGPIRYPCNQVISSPLPRRFSKKLMLAIKRDH